MLTIYQQPITAADRGEHPERTVEAELAAIAGEIAARLDEMEGLKLMSGGALVSKFAACRAISPVAFRMTVQLLSGNVSPLLSYADRAHARGVSKQTVFLETKNELERVRHIFPQLVIALESMRRNALMHEDPTGNADAIAQSNV